MEVAGGVGSGGGGGTGIDSLDKAKETKTKRADQGPDQGLGGSASSVVVVDTKDIMLSCRSSVTGTAATARLSRGGGGGGEGEEREGGKEGEGGARGEQAKLSERQEDKSDLSGSRPSSLRLQGITREEKEKEKEKEEQELREVLAAAAAVATARNSAVSAPPVASSLQGWRYCRRGYEEDGDLAAAPRGRKHNLTSPEPSAESPLVNASGKPQASFGGTNCALFASFDRQLWKTLRLHAQWSAQHSSETKSEWYTERELRLLESEEKSAMVEVLMETETRAARSFQRQMRRRKQEMEMEMERLRRWEWWRLGGETSAAADDAAFAAAWGSSGCGEPGGPGHLLQSCGVASALRRSELLEESAAVLEEGRAFQEAREEARRQQRWADESEELQSLALEAARGKAAKARQRLLQEEGAGAGAGAGSGSGGVMRVTRTSTSAMPSAVSFRQERRLLLAKGGEDDPAMLQPARATALRERYRFALGQVQEQQAPAQVSLRKTR